VCSSDLPKWLVSALMLGKNFSASYQTSIRGTAMHFTHISPSHAVITS
jgi:hypothetical protein